MDRNVLHKGAILRLWVALRKESVDRNTQRRDFKALGLPSLSARRAWIEIVCMKEVLPWALVALRKESVDRNTLRGCYTWIDGLVALRKESVDRNGKNSVNDTVRL